MNVARLLQDSPSDDHRQRQEFRENHQAERGSGDGRERERAWERHREGGTEHEWDGERERNHHREWDRNRAKERTQRGGMSSSSAVPPPTQRSHHPTDGALPPRSRTHAHDTSPPLIPPPAPRSAAASNQTHNNLYSRSSGSDSMHSRAYSQGVHQPSSAHSQLHSPPAPLFLSPLTAPREDAAAGPVPGTALSSAPSEHSANYGHRTKNSTRQMQGKTPPMFSQLERDRERERGYEQRARSLSGSGRSRTPPPYNDYRDGGRVSPPTTRLSHRQHSPAQGPYSVVPPHQQSQPQQHFSPPLSGSLNNSNASLHRMPSAQGPPQSRRPPPPPSASVKHSHDSNGAAAPSAMSRSFDELPYLVRAPSSSSSVMSAGRERTLKEDIERERESLDRERERERERERDRGRERERERERGTEMQRHTGSRSASVGAHASPPNAFSDRIGEREREMVDVENMRDLDTLHAEPSTRMQGQPRDARERDAARHHHHHHHHYTVPHSHLHPHLHSNQNVHPQHQQHLQQQQQPLPHVPGTPYTYAHTGKPRISRSGVLKLAPPGVTVSNNVPPSSSDLIFAGASGVVMRAETLTLAPSSHGHSSQQQHQMQPTLSGLSGSQLIESIPVNVKQPSPPTTSLHQPFEMYHEGSQPYEDSHGYVEGSHTVPHLQQHPSQSNKHNSYSVVPTGPGVPPNGGPSAPPGVQASMITAQQQQQYAQQFGPMPAHQQIHHAHTHQQSLPPPAQLHPSPSPNGIHVQDPGHTHMHPNPYRHMPSGIPSQHQGYPPPSMHYNEVPPPPVSMALQSIPAPSPPMQEPGPPEPPLHLGTFVFPRTPFPYFFPARANSYSRRVSNISPGRSKKGMRLEADLAPEHGECSTHVTILVPSAYLPPSLPSDGRPRIWGGAPLPVLDPWANYVNFPNRSSTCVRRVYTDDSNIVLCALHSGHVSWPGLRRARMAGLDLAVMLALHHDVGRYLGGLSSFADGSTMEGAPDVDVGLKHLLNCKGSREAGKESHADDESWLMAPSASWGSGHDGSGIEVLNAEWMPRGSTRDLGLRNRSQRMREYAERRMVIIKEVSSDMAVAAPRSSLGVLGKRPSRLLDFPCKPLYKDEEMSTARTVMFGNYRGAESAGFKYDPTTIYTILFPAASASLSSSSGRPHRRRKRRKLNGAHGMIGGMELRSDADTDGDFTSNRGRRASPSPCPSGNLCVIKDVILESGDEQLLLALQGTTEETDEDKENCDSTAEIKDGPIVFDKGTKRRRYDLYSLPSLLSPVPVDHPTSPKNASAVNSSEVQKSDVEPMTPKSNRSEPSSPQSANKNLEIVDDAETADQKDVIKAPSFSGQPVTIPTPPATTATVHASSPPSRPVDSYNDEREYTKAPQVLCRNLGAEDIQFLDGGISITNIGRTADNGAEKERNGVFIRVDRWRWAGSRDRLANANVIGRDVVVAG